MPRSAPVARSKAAKRERGCESTEVNRPPMTMVEPACVMAKTAPSSTAGVPVCGMAATTCS